MAVLYEIQEWADLPDKTTPISAERLTHIEDGIYSNSEGIIANADAISTLSESVSELSESAGSSSGTVDVSIATEDTAGIVKPDGTTITITEDGTISAVSSGSSDSDSDSTDYGELYASKEIYADTYVSMGRASGSTVGTNSFAFGYNCTASGNYSHAEGFGTIASGDYSHAEGCYDTYHDWKDYTTASGNYSHAEGFGTYATAMGSHSEGRWSEASGNFSHAEGVETSASASVSHAEGSTTTASGNYSHAEGYYTTAGGKVSHAEGYYTTASTDYQHVQGKYNAEDTSAAMIIGGGTSSSDLLNIFTVDWDGNLTITGSFTAGSTLLTADDDLDSLTSNGDYEISADAIPANVPSGYGINAGSLKVKALSNIAYVTQELWELEDGGVANIWVRSYYGEAWSDWKQAGLS